MDTFHNNKKRLGSHSEEQTPLQVTQYGAEAEGQKHLHTQKQRWTHLCCTYLISLNRHQSSQQTFCHLGLINERERRTETNAVQSSSVKPFICTTLLLGRRKTGISQVTWPFFSFKWSLWAPPAPITDTMCDHVSWWWFDALKTRISDDVVLPASFKQNLWTWPAANQVISSAPVTMVI